MSKWVNVIIGGAEIALGILIAVGTLGGGAALGAMLIVAGAGQVIAGIGTLLSQPRGGLASASRNPIGPWVSIYGRAQVGGTIVYINEFGDSDKYLDLVIVLAAHPCQSVDALLFDNQRVLINPATHSSYSPTQVTATISTIVRSNGVVTVTAPAIPDLQDGDLVQIKNVSDHTFNGRYYVSQVSGTSFTYLCGGLDATVSGSGQVKTTFPDYRSKVYMEAMLGNQTSTFFGLLYGTPYDGDVTNPVIPSSNPWTSDHLLLGKTCVFLRLHYNDEVFTAGIPNISFRVHGKNNILEPRTNTVLGRPSTSLNGWGNNAHVGAYEMGVDQGYGWGLNNDTTYTYSNPGNAVDSSDTTYADATYQHTHKYAGCIWTFGSLTLSGAAYLNIHSEIPADGTGSLSVNHRSAGIWYSLDGGSTWQQVYNATPPRAKQWDTIALASGLATNLIQVMAFTDSHDDMVHYVYDIHIGTAPAGGNGYTENAALCIADYLANTTWGFKATYGTEIPTADLTAAANICDEPVALASGGTEPRYACNGNFPLSVKRGEVLQNLLTSCGGRLTYSGGQFVIHPAAWPGVSYRIGAKPITSATMRVLSSHIPGTGYSAYATANFGTVALIGGTTPFIYDQSAWTLRTDSGVLDPTYDVLDNGHCILGIDGALLGDALPPDQFLIYDCWIDVTFIDGSTAVYRSTRTEIIPSGSGAVLDKDNAIDGSSSTYATVERFHFSGLGSSAYLVLRDFTLAGGGAGPPDTSGEGIVASKAALSIAAGPFTWKSKVTIRDLYNGVKGTYVSPANGWQSSDFPPYAQDTTHGYGSDANVAADGGDRRWKDIQLPFTISAACAQRLAKVELLRARQQGTGTFAFNMSLYQITVLDVVSITLPLLGWNDKLIEISAHRLAINKQQVDGNDVTQLSCEIEVQETDPSVYDWSTSEELTPQGFQQSVSPVPGIPAAPGSVTASSGSTTAIVGADGIARSRIQVTWTAPIDGYVTNGGSIQVQYQLVTSPVSTIWTGLPSVDPSVTQIYIDSVVDGSSYLVQVRSVNAAGIPSDWVPTAPVTVSGTPTVLPPNNIASGGATTGDVLVWNGGDWVPGAAGSVVWHREVPSGILNGSNRVFTLSLAPAILFLWLNGVEQDPGLDYTLSGTTITYAVAPEATDWHLATYST